MRCYITKSYIIYTASYYHSPVHEGEGGVPAEDHISVYSHLMLYLLTAPKLMASFLF